MHVIGAVRRGFHRAWTQLHKTPDRKPHKRTKATQFRSFAVLIFSLQTHRGQRIWVLTWKGHVMQVTIDILQWNCQKWFFTLNPRGVGVEFFKSWSRHLKFYVTPLPWVRSGWLAGVRIQFTADPNWFTAEPYCRKAAELHTVQGANAKFDSKVVAQDFGRRTVSCQNNSPCRSMP